MHAAGLLSDPTPSIVAHISPGAAAILERPRWIPIARVDKYRGDAAEQYGAFLDRYGPDRGPLEFRLRHTPYETVTKVGNIITAAGSAAVFAAIIAGITPKYDTSNAQLVVGAGSASATPADTDMSTAAGATWNTGDFTAATNASPIVLTTAGWSQTPVAGQVVVVSGINGNTAANGTFEVSAATSTTVTLLNSAGNGAFSTSAGSTLKPISKYRQLVSSATASPAVGSGITGVSAGSNPTITTTAAHNLAVNMLVTIAGVGGATGVNGIFAVATVPSANTFTVTAGAPGSYTSGGTVTLTGGAQFVATFGTANANYTWNEWGITTGGAATNKQASPPPTLFNHAVPGGGLGSKTSAASWALTTTLAIY